MDLSKFAELTTNEGPQSAVIYGKPRAGKTTLAAQFARHYNLLWLDLEKGAQTLLHAITKEFWPRVHIIQVDDTQDNPIAIKTVGQLICKNADHKICVEHGATNCVKCTPLVKDNPGAVESWNLYKLNTEWVVVIDSMTQLSDSALAHALGPVAWDDKKKAEFDHWDRQGLLLKNILTAQKLLSCHRIFISHEEELEQEDGQNLLTPCGGTRNFSRKISRYFDHIVYCDIKNMKHISNSMSTASPKFISGSRNEIALEQGDDIVNLFKVKDSDAKPASGNGVQQKPAAAGKFPGIRK